MDGVARVDIAVLDISGIRKHAQLLILGLC